MANEMDWFKGTIAVSALIAASGIFYYFVIFLPTQQHAIYQERRDQEAAIQEKQKSDALAKE